MTRLPIHNPDLTSKIIHLMGGFPDQVPECSKRWGGSSLFSHPVPNGPGVIHLDGHILRFGALGYLVGKQVNCVHIAVKIFVVS